MSVATLWLCCVTISSNGHIVTDGVYDAYGKQSGFAHPQMYELFDLAKDPYELLNIYNSTKSDGSTGQALLTELHGILRQYYECSGVECP
eukprot:COSAG02_NODE_1647_length_11517_cov_2.751533_21_plen_90_part_00